MEFWASKEDVSNYDVINLVGSIDQIQPAEVICFDGVLESSIDYVEIDDSHFYDGMQLINVELDNNQVTMVSI